MFNPSFIFDGAIETVKKSQMMNYLTIKYLNRKVSYINQSKAAYLIYLSCLSCLVCKLKGYTIDDDRSISELAHDSLCVFYADSNDGSTIVSKYFWLIDQFLKKTREINNYFNNNTYILNKFVTEKNINNHDKETIIRETENLLLLTFSCKTNTYYSGNQILKLYN